MTDNNSISRSSFSDARFKALLNSSDSEIIVSHSGLSTLVRGGQFAYSVPDEDGVRSVVPLTPYKDIPASVLPLPSGDPWSSSYLDAGIIGMRGKLAAYLKRQNIACSPKLLSLIGSNAVLRESQVPAGMDVLTGAVMQGVPLVNDPSEWSEADITKTGKKLSSVLVSPQGDHIFRITNEWSTAPCSTPPPDQGFLVRVTDMCFPSGSLLLTKGYYYAKDGGKEIPEAFFVEESITISNPPGKGFLYRIDPVTRQETQYAKLSGSGSYPQRTPTCCPLHYAQFHGAPGELCTRITSVDEASQMIGQVWKQLLTCDSTIDDPLCTEMRGIPLIKFLRPVDDAITQEIVAGMRAALCVREKYISVKRIDTSAVPGSSSAVLWATTDGDLSAAGKCVPSVKMTPWAIGAAAAQRAYDGDGQDGLLILCDMTGGAVDPDSRTRCDGNIRNYGISAQGGKQVKTIHLWAASQRVKAYRRGVVGTGPKAVAYLKDQLSMRPPPQGFVMSVKTPKQKDAAKKQGDSALVNSPSADTDAIRKAYDARQREQWMKLFSQYQLIGDGPSPVKGNKGVNRSNGGGGKANQQGKRKAPKIGGPTKQSKKGSKPKGKGPGPQAKGGRGSFAKFIKQLPSHVVEQAILDME